MDFERDESEWARARGIGGALRGSSGVGMFRALGAAGMLGGDPDAARMSQRAIGLVEGSTDAGLALAWASHMLCARVIARLAPSEACGRWFPGLVLGESIGCLARADRPGVNAPIADVLVIAAKREVFMVERGAGGRVGAAIETSGLRSAAMAAVELESGERLDERAIGLVRRWQRVCMTAVGVGLIAALVEACTSVARQRREGQVGRALLADLRIRSEVCRRIQARAAWRLDREEAGAEHDIAIATAMLGETLATIGPSALQRFGEPLGCTGTIDRLARDAATLARLLDDPVRARTRIAASLLGFEGRVTP